MNTLQQSPSHQGNDKTTSCCRAELDGSIGALSRLVTRACRCAAVASLNVLDSYTADAGAVLALAVLLDLSGAVELNVGALKTTLVGLFQGTMFS
jgi:hypothetical protein